MLSSESTLPKRCPDCDVYLKDVLLSASAEEILPEYKETFLSVLYTY